MSEDLFSQPEEPVNALEEGESPPTASTLELPDLRDSSGQRMAFDEARLRASIERAQRDAGETVTTLANEVTDIVRFTLSSRIVRSVDGGEPASQPSASSVPPLHVDEIGALVERALLEVGATGTARSYIIARDRRMRARDLGHPSAESSGAPGTGGTRAHEAASGQGPRLPSVRGATGAEPFQARRIVAALIEEVGLLPADAAEVAAGVQSILAGAGLRVVSTGLVRELVSSQLLARGLGEAQRRHESVGIPRHDLSQLFQSSQAASIDGPGGTERFEDQVQRGLLRRWFLDDSLDAETAQAHRTGDLFVSGLDSLHRVRFRSLPAQLLLKGAGQSAFAALSRIGRIAGDTSGGLLIEGVEHFYRALGKGQSAGSLALALGAMAESSDRRIDLVAGSDAEASRDALADFFPAMVAALPGEPRLPRIFAGLEGVVEAASVGESVADAAETLLWSGHLVPVWKPEQSTWSGLDRAHGERGSMALGSSVAINLPRLARRAGPWREDVFLGLAAEAVESAAEALVNVAVFQAHARGLHGTAVSDRVAYGVLPVGLVDALRILGDGIARADQGSRILGFLTEAAQRMGAARGLDIRLSVGCTTRDADAAALWFARCDARASGPGQPRLFSDLPRPEEERPRTYAGGVGELTARQDPRRIRERAEALGTLLCTVPSGALVPGPRAPEVGAVAAAQVADFQEGLVRASRRPAGPASGRPSAGGPGNGQENPKLSQVDALLQNRARWPRLAAWARFTEVRGATTAPLAQAAETTLF